jgi:uncharacterized protein
MSTDWIQTNENRALYPRAITKESVGSIREIAHSLANCFRFNRQVEAPYSVAEHCVRGSRLLPPAFAGAFLLHELSEVYLPDIPAPLKPFVAVYLNDRCDEAPETWEHLEKQHTRVILSALGLSSLEPLIYSPEVRAMDLAMLAAEKRDLVGPEPMPWGLEVEPASTEQIVPWANYRARDEFVKRFVELFQVGR